MEALESRVGVSILHKTIQFYTMLYYTVLYYTILYYTILYYTILYYTILYYTILYYTIPYYTILYYTILYYTILYYTILYYTILYYTKLKLGGSTCWIPSGVWDEESYHMAPGSEQLRLQKEVLFHFTLSFLWGLPTTTVVSQVLRAWDFYSTYNWDYSSTYRPSKRP